MFTGAIATLGAINLIRPPHALALYCEPHLMQCVICILTPQRDGHLLDDLLCTKPWERQQIRELCKRRLSRHVVTRDNARTFQQHGRFI